ncbi:MAG: N-acetyl-gamma-glutamyl-phosphate reductase [Pseudomonadota bacterium]
MTRTACVVLGASGYVGGELLRLIGGHPELQLFAAVARQAQDTKLSDYFPHLEPLYRGETFVDFDTMIDSLSDEPLAVFSALPHTQAATQIDAVMQAYSGSELHVVDASADFRFATTAAFESVYGQAHPVPALLSRFARGVPEFVELEGQAHASQPGCFATAMQLAVVPMIKLQLTESAFFASGVTGSTGAGKTPIATTHMPERHANLFAYKALAHRHAPEVTAQVAAATELTPNLHFVPHAGPFARGIHMTVMASTQSNHDAATLHEQLTQFYADAPFVRVTDSPPRLKQVVGSNFARLSIARDGGAVCVTVVIDNLIKGAAGGAMQWMNRLFEWPETLGLDATAVGWS